MAMAYEKYGPIISTTGDCVVISGVHPFDLSQTLDCGQAFRWEQNSDGSWSGIAFGRRLTVSKQNDDILLHNTTLEEYEKIWKTYFDIERNYNIILKQISQNDVLNRAARLAGGIRVLNQQPWETLCSFIISQNNNIARIKGIIKRLCECFGEQIDGGFAFPAAARLAKLSVNDLEPIKSGFRAKYIIDAAQKIANGEIDTKLLYSAPLEQARSELMKIKGVGVKVADCVLLFAFKRIEAFPQDVWIKKAMNYLFDGQLPAEAQPYAGIVQQYIFHYARTTKLELD